MNWRLAERRGEKVHRLPLRITTIPETVCAAFCKPAGSSVRTVIDAIRHVDFRRRGQSSERAG